MKKRNKPPIAETFEKDDDSNGHIDFIASASNIRAINFHIEPKDDLEIKGIVGKIIPAIATTTAMICGLVSLEMYKVHNVDGDKKLSDFRFGVINLAILSFSLFEPVQCKFFECKANNIKYSLWDKWIIEGDLTLGEFLEKMKEKYNLNVDMITIGKKILYSSFQNEKLRLSKKITDILVSELGEKPLCEGQNYLCLDCMCIDDEDQDVSTPPIYLKIR